jgi:hypothetical protein
MEWRETVTMNFFPRTIAGLRPEQQRSHRSMTTVPAKPAQPQPCSSDARNRQASKPGSHEATPIADSDLIMLTRPGHGMGKAAMWVAFFVYF